jgi:hypothetical protein
MAAGAVRGGPRPDPGSVRRVVHVWTSFGGRRRAFVLATMEAIGKDVPAHHPLHPASGSTAAVEVLDALIDAVEGRNAPAALEEGWLRLGAAHAAQGLQGLDYRYLGHAVFRATREVFSDVWSTELGSAWVTYYLWVEGWVTAGSVNAGEARAQDPSRRRPDPGP